MKNHHFENLRELVKVDEKIKPETKGNLLPVCLVCHRTPDRGIRDGLVLGGKFICYACEQEIVSLRGDELTYGRVIDRLKEVWRTLLKRWH